MLTHLEIKNFTTVEHLALEFASGLSTITGETGAGKSVMLDGLALALGGRTPKHSIRDESQAAEFTACFTLPPTSAIRSWLQDKELLDTHKDSAHQDSDDEIICRRVIKSDGRSRAFINGCVVTISDLRNLGLHLVDLHGQHEHQSLLNKATHQRLLDEFGKHVALQREVAALAQNCSRVQLEINRLSASNANGDARQQLLAYQVTELDNLALGAGETNSLASELKMLANAGSLLEQLQTAITLCDNDADPGGALASVNRALGPLQQSVASLPGLKTATELLESAAIQIEEATNELHAQVERVHIDPQRLQQVEHRLDAIYVIARKHQVQPEQLAEHHALLSGELAELANSDEIITQLRDELAEFEVAYHKKAKQLTRKRQAAAKKLIAAVGEKLADLKMKHCTFAVNLTAHAAPAPHGQGHENVEFLIATVPGKPALPLASIASGGELSRISLAIQVVTAQTTDTPTLVFDEVDVGIGGGVAEVVGNLLRELGKSCQVFCVTHLAQVAAKGSQHLVVTKKISSRNATTQIQTVDKPARKAELARMLGGLDVTESTLAHAAEILESA